MARESEYLKKYGPWAIVAGASEGLGEAFADALAVRGFNLTLVARRKDLLEKVAHRLERSHGISVRPLVADLALPETAITIQEECSDIDIGMLVYNAAYALVGDFAAMALDKVNNVIDVNVKGSVGLVHTLLPHLLSRDKAGIVLMSSLAGDHGSPRIAAYAASKAFTTALAQGLWQELMPNGVDVTACVAGAIRTPGFTQTMHLRNSREAPGTLDAPVVAQAALKALGRRPVVVPGVVNSLARFFMNRIISGKAAVKIMSSSTRGLRPTPATNGDIAKEGTND